MNSRVYKVILVAIAGSLLVGGSFTQRALNVERARLGLTRVTPLENAPPLLTFTTVALGGFRGLISNFLWMRASALQEEGKYFEMVQLADWITKLEPHYAQVWRFQAWNMSYNISVKFTAHEDRWRWVERGIQLLRDEGIRYNPHEAELYTELAWQFYHKMGWNLDEAHGLYKGIWVRDMKPIFGTGEINLDGLVNPKSDEDEKRRKLLIETYKMDPAFVLQVDKDFGPLDWRLPEAHAIYWAALGLSKAKNKDLMPLRKIIYQSSKLHFERGRVNFKDAAMQKFNLGPRLDFFPKVNASYEKMMADDPAEKFKIKTGHRNFLGEGIRNLYIHNKIKLAQEWFDYLKKLYPDQVPEKMSLESFVIAEFTEIKQGRSQVQIAGLIEGLLYNYFEQLANEEDESAAGHLQLAKQIHQDYEKKTRSADRVRLTPLAEVQRMVMDRVLDPAYGMEEAQRAYLRARLGLPQEQKNTIPPGIRAPVP